jgi:hypothetical protein
MQASRNPWGSWPERGVLVMIVEEIDNLLQLVLGQVDEQRRKRPGS